jgi:uncharacterized protein (DUF2164 family)
MRAGVPIRAWVKSRRAPDGAIPVNEELDQEVGQFDAGFLLDFFAEEIGAYFYNRGLYDAQGILASRMENIAEAIFEIEKPTQFLK